MFLQSKNLNFPQANHRRNRSAMPAMISIIIEPLPDNQEESQEQQLVVQDEMPKVSEQPFESEILDFGNNDELIEEFNVLSEEIDNRILRKQPTVISFKDELLELEVTLIDQELKKESKTPLQRSLIGPIQVESFSSSAISDLRRQNSIERVNPI